MYAIYYTKDKNDKDYTLRETLQRNNVEISYENNLSNLLVKIVFLKPSILFISDNTSNLRELITDLFDKISPFFVPYIVILKNSMTINIDIPNCIFLSESNRDIILCNIINQAKLDYRVKNLSIFPFNKFEDITAILLKLGFPLGNRGTIFIKDCIAYCVSELGSFDCSISQVYKVVSAMHNTTMVNIERCIRASISYTWRNMNIDKVAQSLDIDRIFLEIQPTSREIILFLSELILHKVQLSWLKNKIPELQYNDYLIKNNI